MTVSVGSVHLIDVQITYINFACVYILLNYNQISDIIKSIVPALLNILWDFYIILLFSF